MKNFSKNVASIIAVSVIGLAFLLLGMIMFRQTTNLEENTIIFVLGSLTGWVSIVLSFYFGSSQGSQHKTDLLNYKKNEQDKETI